MERFITLYESPASPCPYLPDRTWKTHLFSADVFPEPVYESLLEQGFRRSGKHFYHNLALSAEDGIEKSGHHGSD